MDKTFEVTRADECIWITDLRVPEECGLEKARVKHIVPEQARELIEELNKVV